MSKKRHELILIAAALFVCAALFLITVFKQPQYSPLMPAEERSVFAAVLTAVTESREGMIDINTDSIELLKTLDGVGDLKAQAILDYRSENGDFSSIYELRMVEGIGEKILQDNFDRIYVQ